MNKQKILYLILIVSISCKQQNEHSQKTSTVRKLYYLDSNTVSADDSSYANGHFRLIADDSGFRKPWMNSDTIEIFYDKALTRMAERITFIYKDSIERYERFDKAGTIRAADSYKNGHRFKHQSWYNERQLSEVEHSDKNGQRINDTIFSETGTVKEVTLFINDLVYKEIFFYENGNVAVESYRSVSDAEVFAVKYDSITQIPSMYYRKDTTWPDKQNPGVRLAMPRFYPVDSVKIKGQTTKWPLQTMMR